MLSRRPTVPGALVVPPRLRFPSFLLAALPAPLAAQLALPGMEGAEAGPNPVRRVGR